MIALQSLWTGTNGFALTRENALLFSASAACLSDWYPRTELVTDMLGLEIAERLGWSYTTYSTALDNFCPPELRHVWCLGKIHASSIQTKSHVHIDLDILIMGRFKARIEGARTAAQSKDPPGFYKLPAQQAMLALAGIPSYVTPHNTGILLWNDLGLRDKYVSDATKALDLVGRKVACGTSVTVCIEQACYSNVMREEGVKIEEICLMPVAGMVQSPDDMQGSFVHLWGRSKRNAVFIAKVEARFAKDFPAQYAAFVKGYPLLQSAGRVNTIPPPEPPVSYYYYSGGTYLPVPVEPYGPHACYTP